MSMQTPFPAEIPEETRRLVEPLLSEKSVYRLIGAEINEIIQDEDFIEMYADEGRPAVNPVILALVSVFQFIAKLPDRLAAEAVVMRMDWKFALRQELTWRGFHYSDLCNFRKRLLAHGKERVVFERLAEIRAIIKRMGKRWDHGFFASDEEYFQQRLELQQELEQLSPVPDDDLERAADLLEHFADHWEDLKDDPSGQHELVKLIVERVYIDGKSVVAMTLRSNYHLVLGHKVNGPTDFTVDPLAYTSGSDGIRTRDLRLDRPAC